MTKNTRRGYFSCPRVRSRLGMGLVSALCLLALAACGGGGGGGGGSATFTIGGTLSGLSGTLVLQNNGADDLSLTADGAFTFATLLADSGAYAVTVLTQPSGQTCTVASGSGTVAAANVTDVAVTCGTSSSSTFTIGGTVYGLTGTGLVLQNNAGDDLTVNANGVFTFQTANLSAAAYAVTVATQPSGGTENCGVLFSSGAIAGANVTSVVVSCLAPVAALYTSGANWNDYVKNNGTSIFSANGTACDGTEPGGYTVCIHGGEKRVIPLPGLTSCTGVTALDDLNAFVWTCLDGTDATSNPARMVSLALAPEALLSGLIDFAAPGKFKSNSVAVSLGGDSVSTPVSTWWSNPFEIGVAGPVLLDTAGEIYLVTANTTNAYEIKADKVALVVQPGFTVTGGGNLPVEAIGPFSFAWIEGNFDANGETGAVFLKDVTFFVLRGVTARRADSGGDAGPGIGVLLQTSSNNLLANVSATANDVAGISLENSSNNNTLIGVVGSNSLDLYNFSNSGMGISISNSTGNTLVGATADGNVRHGIFLTSSSNNNRLSGLIVTSNTLDGIRLNTSLNNTINDAYVANNGGITTSLLGIVLDVGSNFNTLANLSLHNNSAGISVKSSTNNRLANVTVGAGSTSDTGLILDGAPNTVVSNITVTNINDPAIVLANSTSGAILANVAQGNGFRGLDLVNSDSNTFANLAIAHNTGTGIALTFGSTNNVFTGLLKLGDNSGTNPDCSAGSGNAPGLDDNCAPTNGSDATLTLDLALDASFVAEVTTDDPVNTSDNNNDNLGPGRSLYSNIADWANFENSFRGWGLDGGTAFPDGSNKEVCATGDNCRIWDWSLRTSDTQLREVLALPTGADFIVQAWFVDTNPDTRVFQPPISQADCDTFAPPGSVFDGGSICQSTALRNATEIIGDGIGNENVLCESGETCLYTPNIGSYQGHGALVPAGAFVNGTITGVTLLRYETNGRPALPPLPSPG